MAVPIFSMIEDRQLSMFHFLAARPCWAVVILNATLILKSVFLLTFWCGWLSPYLVNFNETG